MPAHPHSPPKTRGSELVERIEDAAFLGLLFSGAAIVVMILVLFVVF